jgi:CheY-like chemotaxis protein
MSEMLGIWQCEAITAESSQAAMATLQRLGQSPDLVIADYRLQDGVTGVQAIDDVRALFDSEIPAIIVTGDTDPQRLREARASGYQLLHKPVSAARLRSLMDYLMRPPADFRP